MDEEVAAQSVRLLEQSPIERLSLTGLLADVWKYRQYLSAYDAAYVALAERLQVGLVTADVHLAGAPNLQVPITLIPTE